MSLGLLNGSAHHLGFRTGTLVQSTSLQMSYTQGLEDCQIKSNINDTHKIIPLRLVAV